MNREEMIENFSERFSKILGTDAFVADFIEDVMNDYDVSEFMDAHPECTDDELNEFIREHLESFCSDPDTLHDEYFTFVEEIQ